MQCGLGSTEKNGIPRIEGVSPSAAIPGGEVEIRGSGFVSRSFARPVVRFGEAEASVALSGPQRLVVRVPESASGGIVRVTSGAQESQPFPVSVGLQIADNLHPVANPAVHAARHTYPTFSAP